MHVTHNRETAYEAEWWSNFIVIILSYNAGNIGATTTVPVGRVPSNFGDPGDLEILRASWKLTVLPSTSLLNLRREGKKSREGNGWNMGGNVEGTKEELKGIGIHPTWGPFQVFSRGCTCACMRQELRRTAITSLPASRVVGAPYLIGFYTWML